MYHFLYISSINKLISTETKLQSKDNFTHIYNSAENTVQDNFANSVPREVSEGCLSFIKANSKDNINSIKYMISFLKKELSFDYNQREKESLKRKKRMYKEIEYLSDEKFDKISNEFNFYMTNASFEISVIEKVKKYEDFSLMDDEDIKKVVKNGYLNALKENQKISNLNSDIYFKLIDEIHNSDVSLSFSQKDRLNLLKEIKAEAVRNYEYFYSREKRVENMKKYGILTPTFKGQK